jgi:hypothetical protein
MRTGTAGALVALLAAGASAQETRPGIAKNGLRAEYYTGKGLNMTGPATMSRVDPAVDFAWNTEPAAPTIPVPGMSARWSGFIVPRVTDTYTFDLLVDDTGRMWLDGRAVIAENLAVRSCKATLVAGRSYEIKVEFANGPGPGSARLFWSSPMVPRQVVPAEVFFTDPAGASRAGVPSADDQKRVEAVIKDLYKKEAVSTSKDERRALAEELLKKALDEGDLPVTFVFLREAREHAIYAGDVGIAMKAAEAMGRIFDVDSFASRLEVLDKVRPAARTADALGAILEKLLSLCDEAIDQDRYAAAADVIKKSQGLTKDAALDRFAAQFRAREKRVVELRREYAKVEPQAKALAQSPGDAGAALAVGKFLCLDKGDWIRGLDVLAKAGDPLVQRAAELELRNPTAADAQSELADAWWAAGDKESGPARRKACYARSAQWSAQAFPGLLGTARLKISRRMTQLVQISEPTSGLVLSWSFNEGGGASSADGSGKGNHAKLMNECKWGAGVLGGGLELQPTPDYVTGGVAGIPGLTGAKTVSFYYRPKGLGGLMLSVGEWPGGGIHLMFQGPQLGVVKFGGGVLAVDTAPSVVGAWQHAAYTYDGKIHRLYVNGVLKGTTTEPFPAQANVKFIELGRWVDGGSQYPGEIDEVRIYNRALGEAEVAQLAGWLPK